MTENNGSVVWGGGDRAPEGAAAPLTEWMDGKNVTHQKTVRTLLDFLVCRSETSGYSRTTDFVLHSVPSRRPYNCVLSALTSSPIPFLDNPFFVTVCMLRRSQCPFHLT